MPPKKVQTEAQKKNAKKKEAAKRLAAQVKAEAEQKLRDEAEAAGERAREQALEEKQRREREAEQAEKEAMERAKKAAANKRKKEAKKEKAAALLEADSDEVLMAFMKYPPLEAAREALRKEIKPTVDAFHEQGAAAFTSKEGTFKDAMLEEKITQVLCSMDVLSIGPEEKEARQLRKALIADLQANAGRMAALRENVLSGTGV